MADRESLALVVVQDDELREELLEALLVRAVPTRAIETEREVLSATADGSAVLVIDAKLPTMSGFDLAKSVRRQAGADCVAIIIITDVTWTPKQKAAAIQQMGLRELLVKPVDCALVADLVARTLAELSPTHVGDDITIQGAEPTVPGDPLADRASHEEQQLVERAARAVQAESVELRGNLLTNPFPRLLHTLYRRRATGALFLLRDTVKKIVYFTDGHPTYIKSNLLTECLGKVLGREGMITEAQCKESLRRMKEARRQQGTVLIDMGVISPHNLVVGLQLQLQTKLQDIFSWSRGEFLFKSNAKIPSEVIRLDSSAATLIADGVRAAWDEGRLREALSPFLDRHIVPAETPDLRFQELSFDEEEQSFADSVDGGRTLRQLLADSPLPTHKALVVAYTLLAAGVVDTRDEPASADEAQPLAVVPTGPSEEPLRELLATQLLSLRQRDPYGILGVSANASDEAIEQAYSRLAREYHPDRFRRSSGETRKLADEIFGLIYKAYRTVATAELRAEYHRGLSSEEISVASAAGGATLAAERLKREAVTHMGDRSWTEASHALSRAIELCPEEGDLHALLGWCTFNLARDNPSTIQGAIRELRRATKLDPDNYQAHLYLGQIYARMGKSILAERQFEKAVHCNPDGQEALAELRRQQERRPPRRPRAGRAR